MLSRAGQPAVKVKSLYMQCSPASVPNFVTLHSETLMSKHRVILNCAADSGRLCSLVALFARDGKQTIVRDLNL
jgi:hypothetical protein